MFGFLVAKGVCLDFRPAKISNHEDSPEACSAVLLTMALVETCQ